MNIFQLDLDPRVCAEYHCDSHVVKMITEYCQLMSTAHRVIDGKRSQVYSDSGRKQQVWFHPTKNDFLYKTTHENHPSGIWVRQSSENYNWLAKMTKFLAQEYTHRYGRVHKSESGGLVDWFVENLPKNIRVSEFTQAAQTMPDHCKVPGNSVAAYRKCYLTEKSSILKWKNRETPSWVGVKNAV